MVINLKNFVLGTMLILLIVFLVLTLIAILAQWQSKDDLFRATEALLSWPVIAGALAVGAGTEIKACIRKLSQ